MPAAVTELFRDVLNPHFEVRSLSKFFDHLQSAVVFDHEFKYFKSSLLKLHHGKAGEEKIILRNYNENSIIPLLLSTKSQEKEANPEHVSATSTSESQEPDKVEECFEAIDAEQEQQCAKNAMKSELRAYRNQMFSKDIDKQQ